MDITKEAYDKSIELLEKCATPHGFHAAYPGYDAVWARDSMIMSLGASLLENKFKDTFKQSLITLGSHQSPHGQIPNAVDIFSKKRAPHVDYKSIDSTLWFLIGHHVYKERYKDASLFKKHKEKIEKALTWLNYEDMCELGLLDQLPTTDWEDAFPHRYGHTINSLALYYKVLNLYNKTPHARKLKKIVNNDREDGLWNKNFYLAWRWKNHNLYKEKGEWFDSLGNVLAIIFDLADEKKAEKIFSYIRKEKINKPYPMKAMFPPIKKGDKEWQDYFQDCEAREPFHYLNAGIWLYIGAFYVCALVKNKKFNEAKKTLEKIAEANMKLNGNFSEWLDGKTGEPSKGGGQGWNAGMYIAAYESVQKKKCLI